MSKLSSRKMWIFIALSIKYTLLSVYAGMPWEVFSTLETMTFLTFVGGNVGEHFAKK